MSDFFNKRIITSAGHKEFKFYKVWYGAELWHHVDVIDDKGNNLTIRMRKDENGQWVLAAQALPQWVFEVELELIHSLEESQ